MITTYWEMKFNPFSKQGDGELPFESDDFRQATARLKHLCEIKGIGLITGPSGSGKTYTTKLYTDSLNPSLYRIAYMSLSTVSVIEFYKALALELGIIPPFKKVDLFYAIQKRILSLSKDKRVTPIIVCDEGQYLNTKILNDLKILLNFNMDSENHAVFIITGLPVLATTLSMAMHDALAQRIVINYSLSGLSKVEMTEYIESKLKSCGIRENLFAENAIEALWGCCAGAPRVVNSLAEKCLLIGAQKGIKIIDAEIVRLANSEIAFL